MPAVAEGSEPPEANSTFTPRKGIAEQLGGRRKTIRGQDLGQNTHYSSQIARKLAKTSLHASRNEKHQPQRSLKEIAKLNMLASSGPSVNLGFIAQRKWVLKTKLGGKFYAILSMVKSTNAF